MGSGQLGIHFIHILHEGNKRPRPNLISNPDPPNCETRVVPLMYKDVQEEKPKKTNKKNCCIYMYQNISLPLRFE